MRSALAGLCRLIFAGVGFSAFLIFATRAGLVRVGREPHLVVVQHVAAAAEAPLEVIIQSLQPSDLLAIILVRHVYDLVRAVPMLQRQWGNQGS